MREIAEGVMRADDAPLVFGDARHRRLNFRIERLKLPDIVICPALERWAGIGCRLAEGLRNIADIDDRVAHVLEGMRIDAAMIIIFCRFAMPMFMALLRLADRFYVLRGFDHQRLGSARLE